MLVFGSFLPFASFLILLFIVIWNIIGSIFNHFEKKRDPKIFLSPDRIAVHEAGHAIVAWYSTTAQSLEKITIVREDCIGGLCTYKEYDANPSLFIDYSDWLWCKTAIVLAGIAGEIKYYHNFRSGPATEDLQNALYAAKQIEHLNPPWAQKIANKKQYIPPFTEMYETKLSHQ